MSQLLTSQLPDLSLSVSSTVVAAGASVESPVSSIAWMTALKDCGRDVGGVCVYWCVYWCVCVYWGVEEAQKLAIRERG